MNPEPYTTWWLHNEDFSLWYLFYKTDYGSVRVKEYSRRLYDSVDIQGCPIGPTPGIEVIDFDVNRARDRWTELVREGFRMLTNDVGMLEIRDGYQTVWLTLNKSRSKSNNANYALEA